ncbi:MAG: EamA family transporter [Chloroflexi bacterium]|nr:EamA family transporter [Chloroflexota bacterium]
MNDWILPALLSPLLFSVVALIDKRILTEFRIPLPSFNLFVGASQGLIGTVVLLTAPGEGLEAITVASALGIGITQGVGLSIMLWMLKREDPSRVIPAMQTSPIFVALLAWPLFGESLGAIQWLAVVLAVSGGTLASFGARSGGGSYGFSPIYLVLLISASLLAASQLLTKSITDDLATHQIVGFRGIGLFLVMWTLFARRSSLTGLRIFLSKPRQAPWLILSEGAMPFGGHLLITTAISRGPVGLVAAVQGSRPIFVFALSIIGSKFAPGYIFEKLTGRDLALKLASALLVVTAITLISVS